MLRTLSCISYTERAVIILSRIMMEFMATIIRRIRHTSFALISERCLARLSTFSLGFPY